MPEQFESSPQQQEIKKIKWEGETTVEMKSHTPEQIWPLISDFCALNKWFPHVATCSLVEGVPGKPGMIRYCRSTEAPDDEGSQWATEKLLVIDEAEKYFTYEIVDNNAGFKSYVSTMRVVPIDKVGDHDGKSSCRIVWSFVADPVEGFTYEGLLGFLEITLKAMAQRLEAALRG